MRALVAAVLLAAAGTAALTPVADAHTCQGQDYERTCGPCVEGEAHTHQTLGTGQQCVTVKREPGFEAALGLAALGGVALLLARRRG